MNKQAFSGTLKTYSASPLGGWHIHYSGMCLHYLVCPLTYLEDSSIDIITEMHLQ